MIYRVGYFVGSLAAGSINRILSRALIRVAPADLEFVEIPIRDLPLYSYDYDADYPPAGRALKEAIAGVNAVLFVSPEYNRSIPGPLKNAIDWASRPKGTELVRPQALGHHRRLDREDRDGRDAVQPAQRAGVLRLATAQRPRRPTSSSRPRCSARTARSRTRARRPSSPVHGGGSAPSSSAS